MAPSQTEIAFIPAAPGQPTRWSLQWLPGLGLAVLLGLLATVIGRRLPTLGAPVVAVVGGGLLSRLIPPGSAVLTSGLSLARERVLPFSVVLLGAQLSLSEVARVGLSSLPVMLGTLASCLAAAYLLGRALHLTRDLRTLIGVGTAICGASAIAAVSPAIKAKGDDIAYAISTIFLFNVVAVIVFPPLGHALGLSQSEFGLFAGTAVNDTSSVVAAASSYGSAAAQHAVVVKLVRTLMIIPIVLVLGILTRRRSPDALQPVSKVRQAMTSVPWFLLAFVVVVGFNSAGLIPHALHVPVQQLAQLCIAVALAAIGLSTDVQALRTAGVRPLLLGLALWLIVTAASLGLQAAT